MNDLLKKAEKFAKKHYKQNDEKHGWTHVKEVWEVAEKLAENFPETDMEVLKLAVIFHDADYSDPDKHHLNSAELAKGFLQEQDYANEKINKVYQVILDHRGRYRRAEGEAETIEGRIIYDADKFRWAVSPEFYDKYYSLFYLDETRKMVDEYLKKQKGDDKEQDLKVKCREYLSGWKRAQADYQNLQKEFGKKKKEYVQFANANLIMALLPIMDNFKSAFNQIPEQEKDSAWVTGFSYIKKQLEDFLRQNGVENIPTVGQRFDPELHEAVENDQGFDQEKQEGLIIKEMRPGYKLNGRVIQAAKVIVNSKTS